ncbi:aminotransferase class IV [Vallitalea okinawensis]|uniref:aminotransferase class IV n=1 Tax=Vallitalea okinawensis TaxID=2078660 RepID=UPI000CFD2C86|nr:aminotransferase class IV [Vallitalea okinawensis]
MKSQVINCDKGYMFGIGAFETILITDHAVFLESHIKRLNYTLTQLDLNKALDIDEVRLKIKEMGIKSCALKIMVSEENTIYNIRKIPYVEEDYLKGFRLTVAPIKRHSTSPFVYMKTLNFGDNIVARQKALDKGFNECLFLNEHNLVAEGSISNLFAVKGECIYTPHADTGLLKGIVRQWVINHFKVREERIDLDFLRSCDGMFLTNSLMGIMPVTYFEKEIGIQESIIKVRALYEKSIKIKRGEYEWKS